MSSRAIPLTMHVHRPGQLRECPDCGLFQRVPPLRPGQVADCLRCDAVLRRRRRNSLGTMAALIAAGLAMFLIAVTSPLMGLRLAGQERVATLPTLPWAFEQQGMWELAIVVLATTILAPLAKLSLTLGVLAGLRGYVAPSTLAAMARWRSWLTPWSMTEVFLLGLFVAYTRLKAIATVDVGPALFAMGGLMLVMVAADAWLDEHALWDAIGRRRRTRAPEGSGPLVGCDVCGEVSRAGPGGCCPRCNRRLRQRKPDPIARCWALVAAAAALYVPANLFPVMTVIRFGRGHPSTILGGVQELIEYRMWPLALLVLVASVVVPVFKLASLAYLMIATQRRSEANLLGRTRLYRVVETIGRWSMIDMFMLAVLVALVRMGVLASVIPNAGAICFTAVVVLTMLASASFDSRLMWDVAERRRAAAVPLGAPA